MEQFIWLLEKEPPFVLILAAASLLRAAFYAVLIGEPNPLTLTGNWIERQESWFWDDAWGLLREAQGLARGDLNPGELSKSPEVVISSL